MTENQLLYFTTIVSTGSYSETALELNISQSAVSKQVALLEAELGVELFDRSGRRVRLTAAGESLYPQALSIVSKMQELKRDAERMNPAYKKKITVLTLPVIGQSRFYIPLQEFEREHPDYMIELVELEEPALFRRISNHNYDIAITFYDPARMTEQMEFVPVLQDELLLAVQKEDPLALKGSVLLRELEYRRLMGMNKYTCISHMYESYFRKEQVVPKISFRGRPETILTRAEAGNGDALVTRIHAKFFRLTNTCLVPFEPSLFVPFGIVMDKKRNYDSTCRRLIEKMSAM